MNYLQQLKKVCIMVRTEIKENKIHKYHVKCKKKRFVNGYYEKLLFVSSNAKLYFKQQ